MMNEVFWNYGFNVIFNSLLGFITVILFVELLLFVFRVKQSRAKALCRIIPVYKLAFDLFLYNFEAWALMHNINPIEAEPGTRMLNAMFGISSPTFIFPSIFSTAIQFLLSDGKTFTPADLTLLSIDPIWVKVLVSAGIIGAITFGLYQLIQISRSYTQITHVIAESTPCLRLITNQPLAQLLKRKKIQILNSMAIDVPCAIGLLKKRIVFPTKLIEELSQDEFEAVIAHEVGHLRWGDSFIRITSYFICALFWWIPTRWWLVRLEQTQEKACDHQINAFQIPRLSLATAIIKSAKKARTPYSYFPALCFIEKGRIVKRMQAILSETKPKQYLTVRVLQTVFVGCFMLGILFGKFWIF